MNKKRSHRRLRAAISIAATGVLAMTGTAALTISGPSIVAHAATVGNAVSVYLTQPSTSTWLAAQSPVTFTASGPDTNPTILVDPSKTYQTMSGFGASITDTTASNLYGLTSAQRTSLMTQLFSPTNGIGMSYLRQPIGVHDNDLTSGAFSTLDDTASDESTTNLPNFSIAGDEAQVIPLIKQAAILNPELKVLASSWSPPAWMRTGNALTSAGGSLKTADYGLYATYMAKFIKAYEADGVPIDAMTVQNEPGFAPSSYPGMKFDSSEEDSFIKNDLGPTFAANSITSKILVLDHNWNQGSYATSILGDPAAAPYVAGTAFHHYGGTVDQQSAVKRAYPAKDVYFTEGSNNSSTTFKYMMQTQMIDTVRNWAKTVILWNIAADANNGPTHCTPCQPMVTVDTSAGTWSPNLDFRAMGQVSKFVRSGATRIGSNDLGDGSINDVAFTNPDGGTVLVTYNSGTSSKTFQVKEGSSSFDYTLPADTAATFTWSGTSSTRTANAFSKIEAEIYSSATSGIDVQPTNDGSGSEYVGWTSSGTNIVLPGVDFQNGATSVTLRAANGSTATSATLHLDAPTGITIATVPISASGGWSTFATSSAAVSGATGVHDLYVVFNGAFNLDWLQFAGGNAVASSSYSDGFEDGTTSGWTSSGGTWSNCQTPGNSHEYCKTSTTDTGLSLAGSSSWRNYSVQSALVTSATNGSGVSILGRASDSSHFYQLELKRDSTGVESWDLYKNVGGTFTYLTGGNYTFTAGNYYYLRLVMNGSSLSGYIATAYNAPWTLLGSANDTSLSSGGIGLRAAGTATRYDLVSVLQG